MLGDSSSIPFLYLQVYIHNYRKMALKLGATVPSCAMNKLKKIYTYSRHTS